ncbi:unnamed protein product [Chrysoparadoxa australica]
MWPMVADAAIDVIGCFLDDHSHRSLAACCSALFVSLSSPEHSRYLWGALSSSGVVELHPRSFKGSWPPLVASLKCPIPGQTLRIVADPSPGSSSPALMEWQLGLAALGAAAQVLKSVKISLGPASAEESEQKPAIESFLWAFPRQLDPCMTTHLRCLELQHLGIVRVGRRSNLDGGWHRAATGPSLTSQLLIEVLDGGSLALLEKLSLSGHDGVFASNVLAGREPTAAHAVSCDLVRAVETGCPLLQELRTKGLWWLHECGSFPTLLASLEILSCTAQPSSLRRGVRQTQTPAGSSVPSFVAAALALGARCQLRSLTLDARLQELAPLFSANPRCLGLLDVLCVLAPLDSDDTVPTGGIELLVLDGFAADDALPMDM